MGTFDKEKGQLIPDASVSVEQVWSARNQEHPVLTNPLEIDLTQPDHAEKGAMERVTGFADSKLIVDAITPTRRLGVAHIDYGDGESTMMVVGLDVSVDPFLDPGQRMDLSDPGTTGGCVIERDETGKKLYVYADKDATNPMDRYTVISKAIGDYDVPEAPSDDPDDGWSVTDLPQYSGKW